MSIKTTMIIKETPLEHTNNGVYIINIVPENETCGSNALKASTFLFEGDDELPKSDVARLGLLLAGGEDDLGAAATEVSPSLSSMIFSVHRKIQQQATCHQTFKVQNNTFHYGQDYEIHSLLHN